MLMMSNYEQYYRATRWYITYIHCVVVATVARAQLGSACCQLGGGGPQEIANKARKL